MTPDDYDLLPESWLSEPLVTYRSEHVDLCAGLNHALLNAISGVHATLGGETLISRLANTLSQFAWRVLGAPWVEGHPWQGCGHDAMHWLPLALSV